MKRKLSVVFVMIVVLSLPAIAPVNAKAPLVGEMDLEFNLAWPGPQDVVPDWVGTVTIDGDEYGMVFFAIGTGKPFDADPSTNVHFFEEIWKIYDGLNYELVDGVLTAFEPGPVVMWGYDTGLTNLKNSKYHMNGSVEEARSRLRSGLVAVCTWVGSLSGIPSVLLSSPPARSESTDLPRHGQRRCSWSRRGAPLSCPTRRNSRDRWIDRSLPVSERS